MAITNFDINVQGLEQLPADIQGTTQSALARIKQGKVLPQLVSSNIALMLGLSTYTTLGYGTETIVGLDRSKSGVPDTKIETDQVWTQTGNKIHGIQYLTKVDTQLEERFYMDRDDKNHANPETAAALLAAKIRMTAVHFNAILTCEFLNVLTGKVSESSDKRPYTTGANAITVINNSTLGEATTEEGRFNNYFAIRNEVNKKCRIVNERGVFSNPEDYIAIMSLEAYTETTAALKTFTTETVSDIKTQNIKGMVVGGIHVVASPYLGTIFNSADTSVSKILKSKTFDFSKVKCLLFHKQSLALRMWNLMELYVDNRSGHPFFTASSNWGVKDGLIRPEQVTVFLGA